MTIPTEPNGAVKPSSEARRKRLLSLDSGWAVLLGAVLGGLMTYAITNHQVDLESKQSQKQFLHTQALAVYSRAVSDGNDLLETVLTECGKTQDGAAPVPMNDDFETQREALLNDKNNLDLIGTSQTANDVGQELKDLDDWSSTCAGFPASRTVQTLGSDVLRWQDQLVTDTRSDIAK